MSDETETVSGGEWFPVAASAYGGRSAQLMGPRTLLHMLDSCKAVKQDSILDDYALVETSPLRSKCCPVCLRTLARAAKKASK